MAFEDEAKQTGSDFLYLIPGNLRERSRYILDHWGVSVPYSSFDAQWTGLIGHFGIVDTTKKILERFVGTLSPEAIASLRRATRERIEEHEISLYDLWPLVDSDTRKAAKLGLFVLRYGLTLSEELGRLSAAKVYDIGACINWLLQARVSDSVVFEDGSSERHGDRTILGYLRRLARLMQECGLAQLEQERLQGLVSRLEEYYYGGQQSALSHDDRILMLRVLEKVEAVVRQEVRNRDFSELRPTSGILDYQKLPSQVLDGLLGDVAPYVSGLVRQDLEEAIKCLRFGAPTASVMVGLRAVEGWLRELYRGLTNKETRKGWAELLKEIQSLLGQKGVDIEPVTGFLNYIRDVRNKADHPDKTFSQVEAEQIFVAATTAIREIERLK